MWTKWSCRLWKMVKIAKHCQPPFPFQKDDLWVLLTFTTCRWVASSSQVSLILVHSEWVSVQSILLLRGNVPGLWTVSGQQLSYIGAVDVDIALREEMARTNVETHVLFLILSDYVPCWLTLDQHLCLVGMNAIEMFWEEKIGWDLSANGTCWMFKYFNKMYTIHYGMNVIFI